MFTDIGNRFSRIGEQQHVLYYFSRGGKIPRLIPFPRMENPCLSEVHLPLPSARRQAPPTVRCWGRRGRFPIWMPPERKCSAVLQAAAESGRAVFLSP